MVTKIRLVQGDTRPNLVLSLYDSRTNAPIDLSDPATKTHGSDVQGFAHVIDGSAIRHIMNRHFNEKVEITRGQIALTKKILSASP